MIWDELPQEAIGKSVVSSHKRLRACVNVKGGQFRLGAVERFSKLTDEYLGF